MPVSVTLKVISWRPAPTNREDAATTACPSRVNFTAFESRFTST